MNVDSNTVITNLVNKIGQLELEIAMKDAFIQQLQDETAEAETSQVVSD